MKATLTLIVGVFILSGCMNMSGLDAKGSYSCRVPDPRPGMACSSISGVYDKTINEDYATPASSTTKSDDKKSSGPEQYGSNKKSVTLDDGKLSPRDMKAPESGMPIRQPPLVLRVWVAPYEDDSGDLHDQSYFYTMIHSGKWMIEANRTKISNQFRPTYPLKQKNQQEEADKNPPKGAQVGPLMQRPQYENMVDRPNYANPQQPQ